MSPDLLSTRPLRTRLTGRDHASDRHVEIFADRRPDGELVVETRSGEGYYYLSPPFKRDPDGTLIARWVEDRTTSCLDAVERESRPRLGSL